MPKRIWKDVTYLIRGKNFAIVKVRMESEEKAKIYFVGPLKTDDVIPLRTSMGRKILRIRINNIPPTINAIVVWW